MQGSLPGTKQPVPARSRPTQLRQTCVKPWRISLAASRRCSTLLGTAPVRSFLEGHHHTHSSTQSTFHYDQNPAAWSTVKLGMKSPAYNSAGQTAQH